MNCPPIQKDLPYVSVACDRDGDRYIWGNAVMVQSDGKGLSLCEVQVYAETYGKEQDVCQVRDQYNDANNVIIA